MEAACCYKCLARLHHNNNNWQTRKIEFLGKTPIRDFLPVHVCQSYKHCIELHGVSDQISVITCNLSQSKVLLCGSARTLCPCSPAWEITRSISGKHNETLPNPLILSSTQKHIYRLFSNDCRYIFIECISPHSLSQLGIWGSFGHPSPQRSPFRTANSLYILGP